MEKVSYPSGSGVIVVAEPDTNGIVIVLDDDGSYKRVAEVSLTKDKIRDDIIELTLSHMENKSHPIEANAYYLFSDLMVKYDIKPR